MDSITSHMLKKHIWTFEEVQKAALPYNTSTEFNEGNSKAYVATTRKFDIQKVAPHFKRRHEWTKENILKEAKKYENASEFKSSAHQAGKAARRLKISNEINKLFTKEKPVAGILKDLLKLPGVYFLYNKEEIVYIGKSSNCIKSRVISHIKDDYKTFNKIVAYEIHNTADINIAEIYLIGKHIPIYNKDKGNDIVTTIEISNLNDIIQSEITYTKGSKTWNM